LKPVCLKKSQENKYKWKDEYLNPLIILAVEEIGFLFFYVNFAVEGAKRINARPLQR
jgi:hypothetical protein